MNCPKCGNRLRIVRTVSAGPAGKASEAVCDDCEARFTTVTMFLSPSGGRGRGAHATAGRLRRGEITVEVKNDD